MRPRSYLLALFASASLLHWPLCLADALHEAAMKGDVALVEQLLKQGHDINSRDENDATPLHWAVYAGHETLARLLIARGADVYANETPICLARPATPAQQSESGDGTSGVTPLHWAATGGHRTSAELLIAEGANVNAKSADGTTPLAVARLLRHQEIVNVLQRHGALE
ncbi:MAG: ankyrin repeat domain-containing protein [Acidiferrobacterales bacterium]